MTRLAGTGSYHVGQSVTRDPLLPIAATPLASLFIPSYQQNPGAMRPGDHGYQTTIDSHVDVAGNKPVPKRPHTHEGIVGSIIPLVPAEGRQVIFGSDPTLTGTIYQGAAAEHWAKHPTALRVTAPLTAPGGPYKVNSGAAFTLIYIPAVGERISKAQRQGTQKIFTLAEIAEIQRARPHEQTALAQQVQSVYSDGMWAITLGAGSLGELEYVPSMAFLVRGFGQTEPQPFDGKKNLLHLLADTPITLVKRSKEGFNVSYQKLIEVGGQRIDLSDPKYQLQFLLGVQRPDGSIIPQAQPGFPVLEFANPGYAPDKVTVLTPTMNQGTAVQTLVDRLDQGQNPVVQGFRVDLAQVRAKLAQTGAPEYRMVFGSSREAMSKLRQSDATRFRLSEAVQIDDMAVPGVVGYLSITPSGVPAWHPMPLEQHTTYFKAAPGAVTQKDLVSPVRLRDWTTVVPTTLVSKPNMKTQLRWHQKDGIEGEQTVITQTFKVAM